MTPNVEVINGMALMLNPEHCWSCAPGIQYIKLSVTAVEECLG